ncbi:M28 family metallopeptidase [Mycobacterium haemophilum]|uniref:Peptidase M28 n=1 Tax=Mycobacterium haemophilum TaxID=29311 RepID=A0A0I9UW20_9MYCO|nr:M28 family peptidase [Mycobacterium haemophilum]KLO27383.1 peptidase M28 [Mycobacterium haemophilum]KLO35034.1 peptidase M28 [Mycobacterium haemophilum]KLO39979.1 peptidase M28 [Mycobacterium haemophilum]KLO47309.1 peptidase M28 [Mycobacterium haemophilum]
MTAITALPTELDTMREVVEALAPIERAAGQPGEQQAARWIVERLGAAGAHNARVEEEQFYDGYPRLHAKLTAVGVVAGVAGLVSRRLRGPAAVAGLSAGLAIADDCSNGARVVRRTVQKPRTTWNVVAEAGDLAGKQTVVVCAHHDAAHSGKFFEAGFHEAIVDRFPGIVERIDTSLPNWWPAIFAPVIAGVGALRGSRKMMVTGAVMSAIATALFADIARSPIVPGANDNLSAVALLVALAERLRNRPVQGVRVLLVSLGAEEQLQGGIYGFMARHKSELDRDQTYFLNFDTIGSPELIMLEGEGTTIMEDYYHRPFRDQVVRAAEHADAPLRRGMRARNSTDAVLMSRAGYPTACFSSIDRHKALSNYHQMSDTPENLVYETVMHAVTVAEAVVRELTR